jgi:hypothetical protein
LSVYGLIRLNPSEKLSFSVGVYEITNCTRSYFALLLENYMRFGIGVALLVLILFSMSDTSATEKATAAPLDEPKKTEDNKDEKKTPSFKNDVMPILTNSCTNCHGVKKKRGGVDLSSYEMVMKSVKASEPEKSRLVMSVTGQGAKIMPPKSPLAEDKIKILRDWIAAGAKND